MSKAKEEIEYIRLFARVAGQAAILSDAYVKRLKKIGVDVDALLKEGSAQRMKPIPRGSPWVNPYDQS